MDEQLKLEINTIRDVLDSFEKSDFDSMTSFYHSSGFPRGCCGDATDLLALYISKYHNKSSTYVCGVGLGDNPNQSHAWLICDGYLIDITADQFNEKGYNLPRVILTKQSDFHCLFQSVKSHVFDAGSLNQSAIPRVLIKVVGKMEATA